MRDYDGGFYFLCIVYIAWYVLILLWVYNVKGVCQVQYDERAMGRVRTRARINGWQRESHVGSLILLENLNLLC